MKNIKVTGQDRNSPWRFYCIFRSTVTSGELDTTAKFSLECSGPSLLTFLSKRDRLVSFGKTVLERYYDLLPHQIVFVNKSDGKGTCILRLKQNEPVR